MEGTGLSAGMFSLKTSYEGKGVFDYGANPITKGGKARLAVSAAQPTASMTLSDGNQVTAGFWKSPAVTIIPSIPLLLQD